MGGATPASYALYSGRLALPPNCSDLTSCHNQVVSRVIPLMLHGLLIAWMVMSVTRHVVQVGLCMGTTRSRCNGRVFSLGRSASTWEAGLSSVFSLGTKHLLQCTSL